LSEARVVGKRESEDGQCVEMCGVREGRETREGGDGGEKVKKERKMDWRRGGR